MAHSPQSPTLDSEPWHHCNSPTWLLVPETDLDAYDRSLARLAAALDAVCTVVRVAPAVRESGGG